jgi:hypothetical protein
VEEELCGGRRWLLLGGWGRSWRTAAAAVAAARGGGRLREEEFGPVSAGPPPGWSLERLDRRVPQARGRCSLQGAGVCIYILTVCRSACPACSARCASVGGRTVRVCPVETFLLRWFWWAVGHSPVDPDRLWTGRVRSLAHVATGGVTHPRGAPIRVRGHSGPADESSPRSGGARHGRSESRPGSYGSGRTAMPPRVTRTQDGFARSRPCGCMKRGA